MWADRRMVLVEWRDACGSADWLSETEAPTPVVCWSMGLIVKDDEDGIILAATFSADNAINQSMAIPRGMIVSIEDLQK